MLLATFPFLITLPHRPVGKKVMLKNTLAHLGGRGFSSAVGFVIATLIAAHLGGAAMGIYGIYMMLQGLMGILDGGMSTSINRAMAIGTATEHDRQASLQLFRFYEIATFFIAVLIVLGTGLGLPPLIAFWGEGAHASLFSKTLSFSMGCALALRFMQTLYQNVLFGAQKHVRANTVIGAFACARAGLIVFGLLVFKTDLIGLFLLLALSTLVELIAIVDSCRRCALWRIRLKPSWRLFKATASFMAPVSGYSLIALLLSQADRVIAGHFISLEEFGAYSLIASYAAGITSLAYAPGNVFYPLVTQAIHADDRKAIKQSARKTLLMILALTYPVFFWGLFYGPDLGALLFGASPVAVLSESLWLPLFITGAVNVLSLIPFKIFLGLNRADLILKTNGALLILYPVGMIAGILLFGYPHGLYALPLLAATVLVAYTVFLIRLLPQGKAIALHILKDATAFGLGLAFFYAITHAFGMFQATSPIALGACIGWPLAVASGALFAGSRAFTG